MLILATALMFVPPPAAASLPAGRLQQDGVVVVHTQLKVEIADGAATTALEQTFANRTDRPAEAAWLLPTPVGAVADALELRADGRTLQAEALDGPAARAVYEAIVRQRRDPALLEHMGDGLLRARIFPIPPHGEATVSVRLRQSPAMHQGMGEWSWPLRALRSAFRNVGPILCDLRIQSSSALKTVVCSRADAETLWHSDREVRVCCEIAPDAPIERDLQALYGLSDAEFGVHARMHKKAGEPGWFSLFVSPRRSLPEDELPPRCVQFVVDTSGSMRGSKIEQAKAALQSFLATLRPGDRFDLIPFSTEARPVFGSPQEVTERSLLAARQAIERISASGGTDLADALQRALRGAAASPRAGEAPMVVLLTDGRPTVGITAAHQILAQAKADNLAGAPLFLFGVGNDLAAALMTDLAHDHRGACEFLREDEAIERKTSALCRRIREPALTDVTVECSGLGRFETAVRALPDLFAGDTLQVCGRYEGAGTHEVVLRGKLCGRPCERRFAVSFPEAEVGNDFVPVSWAQQRIDQLLRHVRRGAKGGELVDEVRQLGREFGLTTPYTSHVAVEDVPLRQWGPGPTTGGAYRGPGDAMPPTPGGGGGGASGPKGPATAGPALPSGPRSGSDEFYLGSTRAVASTTQVCRRAAGRTFYCNHGVWIEGSITSEQAAAAEVVEAFSEAHFLLLQQCPELREALALGDEVVLRVGARLVRVTAQKAKAGDESRAVSAR